MKIKAGQIICITTGEYSDYGIRDHLRAIRGFDSSELIEDFKGTEFYRAADYEGDDADEYGSDSRFLAWLIRQGIVEPLDANEVVELHIGSYGRLG